MFNTKAGMNEKSDLERIIRANKVYNPTPIAGGGSITYYLNDKNQLISSIHPVYWNTDLKGFVPDTANYTEQLVDIGAIDLNYSLNTQALTKIRDKNYELMGNEMSHEDKIDLLEQQPNQEATQ